MRKSLLNYQVITLTSEIDASYHRTFEIIETLGSGFSCFAYRAIDTERKLPVILKECFPHNTVHRDVTGNLVWNKTDEESSAKERFRKAFKTQRQIQSNDEMMNISTHLVDVLHSGNNTLYTVSDIQNAKVYSDVNDSSLKNIYIAAKALTNAIGKYHSYGLLHLDIKPQNILILPETPEAIRLMDFDSVINKSDAIRAGTSISYTHEYAAPELLQGKRKKLCEATDIYAIGAVIFSRIFGCAPSSEDRGTFSDWNFSDNKLFSRLSNKIHRLTRELFHKT